MLGALLCVVAPHSVFNDPPEIPSLVSKECEVVPGQGRPAEPDISLLAPAPPHLSYTAQADVLILLSLSKFKEFTVVPEHTWNPY